MNTETMLAKMTRLQAENTRLIAIAGKTGEEIRLSRIEKNAQQLIIWRFSGYAITYRAVGEFGMTRRAWQWARALLMYARVHDGTDVTVPYFNDAITRLKEAVNLLYSRGLEPLKLYLPQYVLLENNYKTASQNGSQRASQNMRQSLSQNGQLSGAHSGEKRAVGEGVSRGNDRDRRSEIEKRLGMQPGRAT